MSPRVATLLAAALPVALSLAATPAQAKLAVLTVTGRVTSGIDDGLDLDDVTNGPEGYVEHFVPGTVFGQAGNLAGATIRFRLTYDTGSPYVPVATDGLFDDTFGQWLYASKSEVTIGGVTHDFLPIAPVFGGLALGAKLQLTDGPLDGLSGAFNGFTFDGGTITNYRSSAFTFDGVLPANFLTTGDTLPGGLPGPDYGFGYAKATGTGSFLFSRQSCFRSRSYTGASGDFAIQSISFGAVPEPASWATLIVGLGMTGVAGAAARRRRSTQVLA